MQLAAKPTATVWADLSHTALLQRKCACSSSSGAECEECKNKGETLQRRAKSGSGSAVSAVPPIVHEVLRSPGQPLDATTRAFFEPRFGHDFSKVRVHADPQGAESASAVSALAYTVGRHVAFGSGQYVPHTTSGRELIAHELAHVVQQRHTSDALPSPLTVSYASDDREREANRAAGDIVGSSSSTTAQLSNTASGVQRAPLHDDSVPPRTSEQRLGAHEPLPYRESTELLKCIEIMGEQNDAYCRQQVLGEKPEKPANIPCKPDEAKRADKQADSARQAALPLVQKARVAQQHIESQWSNAKADLIAGRRTLTGEAVCAFNSNFNITPRDPNYGVRQINVEMRLQHLAARMSKAVATECQPSGDPECSGTHRDTVAYVRGGQAPIHLCPQFRDDPDILGQQTTIVHEFAHFLPGVGDAGGYAFGGLGAETSTCDVGTKFKAESGVLTNTADALAGFVMNVGESKDTEVKVK